MYVVDIFSSLRLPFSLSDDLCVRLNDNPCEQKFVITVRRLQGTNVILPHYREGHRRERTLLLCITSTEGEERVSFIGFFVCGLLSLKEFPPSVSRVNIRIPAFPFCPFKTPVGLPTFFFYSKSFFSSSNELLLFRNVTVRFYSNSYSRMQLRSFVFLLSVTDPLLG